LAGAEHNAKGKLKILGLNPNVFLLGLVSFLTDVSSEMIFTLVPIFLSNVLGVSTTIIGFIGGLSDSTEAVFKIFSGWFSDRLNKRKYLAVLGYGLSALAKPFMYVAATWGIVTAVRFSDRVGKGIRSSPRDALLADSLTARERGRGFGLHKAMDSLGAFLGLLLAALIIYQTQGGGLELSLSTYRWLVIFGVIPGFMAMLIFFFIREQHVRKVNQTSSANGWNPLKWKLGLDARFKVFLGLMVLFTLGNSSDFFIILRAQTMGAPLIQITLMLVLFNVTYTLIAWPAGILSDKLGRRKVIILGWSIYVLSYLGFALTGGIWQVWLLFALYGVYYGIVEGVAKAFVADLVPAEKRGTAYGLYHGMVGLALLPASIIAGWLWTSINPSATFYFGATLAFTAMLGMLILVKEPRKAG
jgi:MFS family permease